MSVISRTIDRYYAIKIMTILAKEFPEWPAFKTGVIDAVGNLIKRPKTSEEKDSYTKLDAVLRPVKVALNKFPGGASSLARAYMVKNFLYEQKLAQHAVYEAHRAYELDGDEVDAYIIGIVTEALVGYIPNDDSIMSIVEEMVAGDAGGDAKKIAAGTNSGAITNVGPQVLNKKLTKKKKDDKIAL